VIKGVAVVATLFTGMPTGTGTAPAGSSIGDPTQIGSEAISLGCYHQSLGGVWTKIEWTTSTVGANIFTATIARNTIPNLTFYRGWKPDPGSRNVRFWDRETSAPSSLD
jgi:hypothetical protein